MDLMIRSFVILPITIMIVFFSMTGHADGLVGNYIEADGIHVPRLHRPLDVIIKDDWSDKVNNILNGPSYTGRIGIRNSSFYGNNPVSWDRLQRNRSWDRLQKRLRDRKRLHRDK